MGDANDEIVEGEGSEPVEAGAEGSEFIHFGTLEKTARQDDGILQGMASGNIHKQSADQETLELSAVTNPVTTPVRSLSRALKP